MSKVIQIQIVLSVRTSIIEKYGKSDELTFDRGEGDSPGVEFLEADDWDLAAGLAPASVHVEVYVSCMKQSSFHISITSLNMSESFGVCTQQWPMG